MLQEVDDGAPRSRELDLGRELARALGFEHYAIGHNVTLRKGRYGNATLSRWPIQRERNIDLTVGFLQAPRLPAHADRGADARPGGRGGWRCSTCTSASPRASASARSACSCARASSPRLPFDVPCVVAGDFNDWRSLLRPIFVDMLGVPLRDRRQPRPRARHRHLPVLLPAGRRSTAIYYRGPLRLAAAKRCRLAVSRVASDHLPVVADFDLH